MSVGKQFLLHLRYSQDRMKIYEDVVLQGMARSLIPLERFEAAAGGPTQRDLILLELLKWFKAEFFRWFSEPKCTKCPDAPKMDHFGFLDPSREDQFYGASRVEGYKCANCLEIYRFPRYNQPEKLLETREGRCGEWANCFALCCRSLGYDTRWVEDNADHVWTEVYSEQQQRWLHCDSCENTCDKPLMYESGWGKTYSYVMAFSIDEIADVTWRYTADHKEVLRRRNRVSETELARWIFDENRRIQSALPLPRRLAISKRFVAELVELLCPRKELKEGETEGRGSGSVEWRKARGELGQTACTTTDAVEGFVIAPSDAEVKQKRLEWTYSAVNDKYYRTDSSGISTEFITGWQSAVFRSDGVFRKVESDWQMAYLARVERSHQGELAWRIHCGDLKVKTVSLQMITKCYESGNVVVTICSNTGLCVRYKTDDSEQTFEDFQGANELTITAKLSGGSGDSTWQQAQLFRSPLSDQKGKQLRIVVEFQ